MLLTYNTCTLLRALQQKLKLSGARLHLVPRMRQLVKICVPLAYNLVNFTLTHRHHLAFLCEFLAQLCSPIFTL